MANTLPLPCSSTAFVAKILPQPCISTAFVAKTAPLPPVSTAVVAKTLYLSCSSTAVVAKSLPLPLRVHRYESVVVGLFSIITGKRCVPPRPFERGGVRAQQLVIGPAFRGILLIALVSVPFAG